MRTIETSFETFGASVLLLGYKKDNLASKIVIDCADALEEYQGATATLSIVDPEGTVYPGDVTIEAGVVTWPVKARDTAYPGRGSARLDLVDNGGTVVASCEGLTMILDTHMSGVAPDAILDWVDQASDALTEVRALLLDLNEDIEDVAVAEAARVLAEQGRVSAEELRVIAENARANAESGRVTAESGRVTAEQGRATAEQGRVTAEQGRVTAEQGRVTAEQGRVTAEQGRVTAEQGRVTAEQGRVAAETLRQQFEEQRESNETTRENRETSRRAGEGDRQHQESLRAQAETIRNTNETNRVTAEQGRASAEQGRVTAEAARETAEEEREAGYATIEQNAQAALSYIGPSESTSTAAAAHAQGSYLIYDGKLYQATADIAIGDTLAATGTGANIAQVTGGAMGEVTDLKSAVKNNNKVLYNANVNASGEIIYASQYDLYVFQTPENGFIDSLKAPDGVAVYAYFTTEPVVGSTSYNSSRTVATGAEIKKLFVPTGCNYIAIRQDHTHAASIYPQNAIDVAQFIANQQIGFKSLISANADLNNYNDPGVYQYSAADNIAHDPFNGKGGTTFVINIKANRSGVNGSVSQFAYQYSHMDKGFMFRQENSQHVWTAWRNIGIFDQASGASIPSTKVFGYSDFEDNDSIYLNEMRYRKVVYGGGKIYCGTFCGTNTNFPYYFSVITGKNGRFYRQNISVQHYGITINVDGSNVDFSTLKDSDNYTMQISDMEYYNDYLYCAMRWGAGAGSDPTVNNSYLIVINASTMQTTAWFAMKTDRISTVHVDARKKLLVTGDRGGGFTVYDLTNPGVPSKIASHSQTGIIEYQHSDVYTNGSNETCIAFGVYTSGVACYKISGSTITDLFTWNGLSEIGSNLNVFAVAVQYPYLYATISPMNNERQSGSRIMGIVTLDISDPSNIVNYGFTPIPENMCGDYPAYIVNTNGTLTLAGPADPAPNYIKVNGNYLYVSNENKGIAVFSLASYKYPTFAGLIPTGTWNRYFSISNNLIFTGGDYDYLTGEKPKVVITSCVLS